MTSYGIIQRLYYSDNGTIRSVNEPISLQGFAELLGVSQRRARAIVESNHLASRLLGNTRIIDTDDIRHYQRVRKRSAGQPLKAANAWQQICFQLDPRSPPDELDEARRRVRSRADHLPWYAHPAIIKRFRENDQRHAVIGGSDAASALGVPVGGPNNLLHVYTRSRHVEELAKQAQPEQSSPARANMIVHSVSDDTWPFHGERHAALNVAWLDMADHDERGAEMVIREWRHR